MQYNLSVLDKSENFDVRVTVDLPAHSVRLVKTIINNVVLRQEAPAVLAARLISKLIDISDDPGNSEVSNQPSYDGYTVTINLADRIVTITDRDGIDPDTWRFAIDFDGDAAHIAFADLYEWSGRSGK